MNPKLKQAKTISEDKPEKPKYLIQSIMEQNYAKLSKAKEKFTDPLFPPEEKSIKSGNAKKGEEKKEPEIPSFIKVR